MLDELLLAIVEHPHDEARYSVLADWLEEHDDPRRAELFRLHRRLIATCCEPDARPERANWQSRVVALLAQGVRPCVPERTVLLGKRLKLPMRFAWVPPGTFLMGSPQEEEGREYGDNLHRVTLTNGFWMGVYPVTFAQWTWAMGGQSSRANYPAHDLSWNQCVQLCGAVEEKTGRRFRLPTEAEWEYACRAGTTSPFHFGDTISTVEANLDENYSSGREQVGYPIGGEQIEVGKFPPNSWGLFDLHGGVWEWCYDWFGEYDDDAVTDPTGPNDGTVCVSRGGSRYSKPRQCRSAYRGWCDPVQFNYSGCRVIFCPEEKGEG